MDPSRLCDAALIGLRIASRSPSPATRHDRHGIVTRSAGLCAQHYLPSPSSTSSNTGRRGWGGGQDVVSSQMIDRVTRSWPEALRGAGWLKCSLMACSMVRGLRGEESAGATFLVWMAPFGHGQRWNVPVSARRSRRDDRDPGITTSSRRSVSCYDRLRPPRKQKQCERLSPNSSAQIGWRKSNVLSRAGQRAPIGGLK